MAGMVRGKNICLTPSAFIIGNIIPEALCFTTMEKKRFNVKTFTLIKVYYFRKKATYRDESSTKPQPLN